MQPEDFSANAAVTLRKDPRGYWAALPGTIPPEIPPSWDLFLALSEADRALSELAGVARTLPNPHLLIRPFMRKEAVLSSRIEGTQASLSDLLIFEASDEREERTSDVREVRNYIRALEHGLTALLTFPLSLRFLRELHGILMVDPTKTPGEFRTTQNWIGPPGCMLNDASYVPPPPDALLEHMGALEKFLHEPSAVPPILKYAIAHYQFEAIHPFLDGNGRLGRLLITLLLCADPAIDHPILPQPLLYLSAYFERNRREYYERLNNVSRRGEWLEWFRFFLRGVAEQARDALRRSDDLFSLREAHRDRIQAARGSALLHRIDDHLFTSPVVTVREIANVSGRSYVGCRNAIQKLVDLEILDVVPGQAHPRLYMASDIVRALE